MDEILDLVESVSEGFQSGVLRALCVLCACLRALCVHPDLSGHNLYIYAWISKLFGKVVLVDEKKCDLKHLFR